MMQFVFGRPGSGLSDYMTDKLQEVLHEGRRVWLIVPEQQVYTAERNLLSTVPSDRIPDLSIVSFTRLADLLADRFGGRSRHTVTRAMKALFMWQNLRELTGILETYTRSTATDGALCRSMLRTVEEFRLNGITPTELERAADRLEKDSPLRAKLRDIALIGSAYDRLVTETLGENAADRLIRAAEQIQAYDVFAGDMVFVDSFTSFTAQEYAVLRAMLKSAADMTVSFACGGRYEREPQFESMTDAVCRLTHLCDDAGVDWEDRSLPRASVSETTEIGLLERALWDFDFIQTDDHLPSVPARGQVRLTVSPTLYDEAEAAALHILELAEAGIPFDRMAVVVRDTAAWSGVLDAALEKYHIPFFLSERTDLNEKPAARLLLTALSCVARHWQAEDMVTLAKTGLCGVSSRDVDYFAEYVDTWHLTGRRMTDTAWSMNPDGYVTDLSPRALGILEAANRVRETLMTPLLTLQQDLSTAETVTSQCRALFAYLTALNVKAQLSAGAEERLRLGQMRAAGEDVRLWSFLCETLATVASAMQEADPMSADELRTALSLVFAETDIGSVPARHDCVTIGSASTLRVNNIRAMLILGLNEGEFPQAVKDEGLLSAQDKEALSDLGVELASRAGRLRSEELLYVWRAMTQPTDCLCLSRSTSTPDGQPKAPSPAIDRVRLVLPYLTETAFSVRMLSDGPVDRYRTPTEDSVSRPVARALHGDEVWLSQSRLQTYARCPYSYFGSYILRLREPVVAKMDNLGAGVFLHHVMEQYLRRALDDENRIRPMDADEVRTLTDAIIEAYMTEVCGDVTENGRLLHIFDRLRQVALVLIDSIQQELSRSDFRVAGLEWDTHGRRPEDPRPMTITLESDRTGTTDDGILTDNPDAFARSFMEANYPVNRTPLAESGENALPTTRPVQNLTPEGVEGLPIFTPPEESPVRLLLGGRIDRVDLYRAADGETVYIRVVDYKSSKHEFSVRSITEDMNVQLLLYLFTLCSPENRALFADRDGHIPARVLPAAAVYISPDESSRDGEIRTMRTGITITEPEVVEAVGHAPDTLYLPSVKRNKSGKITGRGLVSPEQMADLQNTLVTAIRDTAATMYDGCARRTPSEAACRYCRMKASCGVSV